MRSIHSLSLLFAALSGLGSFACQSGGVGDPCIPEDEYNQDFSGAAVTEVNVESKSFQCETRVCLAAYFNGRVSCPYGQAKGTDTGDSACYTPGYRPTGNAQTDNANKINVVVEPQVVSRRPDKAVYCSCRCDGNDKNARYCQCPDGYKCQKLIPELGIQGGQLAGSYCVKSTALVSDTKPLLTAPRCLAGTGNCGTDLHPTY